MQRSLLLSRICMNSMNTKSLSSLAVKYAATGSPLSVLKLETLPSSPVLTNPTDVIIKMLASPINPSDLNMAEGTYGIKATLPAIGGNEGITITITITITIITTTTIIVITNINTTTINNIRSSCSY